MAAAKKSKKCLDRSTANKKRSWEQQRNHERISRKKVGDASRIRNEEGKA
jgi:hypothetical protein